MDFITITQYFNKLQSALFLLLIAPLLVFIALYVFVNGMPPDPRSEYFIIFPAVVLTDWLMAVIIFNKKIKSVRNEQGLGAKLAKYFSIAIVRYSLLSAGSLILALGLYLSGSDLFIVLYAVGLVLSTIVWPTGRRVCHDLRLKGDEREMVYYKKDNF